CGTGGRGLVWYRGWYRGDGVSVPIWPKGQIGTLTPSPLYHTKPRPPVPPSPVPLFHQAPSPCSTSLCPKNVKFM
ncbi:MAG: hypothetical protein FWE96_07595, partial [Coriobacteriia bacterium]|nr:hypothetical protein [Coriobacteriia bacterium]